MYGPEHDTCSIGTVVSIKDKIAGDMRLGQSLVVWAIAEGWATVAQMGRALMGYTRLI